MQNNPIQTDSHSLAVNTENFAWGLKPHYKILARSSAEEKENNTLEERYCT